MREVQRNSKVDGHSAYHEVMNLENLSKKQQFGKCSAKKERLIKTIVGGVIIPKKTFATI